MDLQEWKSVAKARLAKLAGRVKELAPGTVYGALCASTVLPVVTAAGQGDFAAVAALGGVLGGVGGNLIANRLQAWRDRSEQEVAAELGEKARDDEQWRDALDTLLEEFEATQVVQAGLSEGDRQWFADALREELHKLGNLERYQAVLSGSGAIVQGAEAKGAGERGVVADTVQDSTIITGDHNRNVQAETYIEHQDVHIDNTPALDPSHLRTAYLESPVRADRGAVPGRG